MTWDKWEKYCCLPTWPTFHLPLIRHVRQFIDFRRLKQINWISCLQTAMSFWLWLETYALSTSINEKHYISWAFGDWIRCEKYSMYNNLSNLLKRGYTDWCFPQTWDSQCVWSEFSDLPSTILGIVLLGQRNRIYVNCYTSVLVWNELIPQVALWSRSDHN